MYTKVVGDGMLMAYQDSLFFSLNCYELNPMRMSDRDETGLATGGGRGELPVWSIVDSW